MTTHTSDDRPTGTPGPAPDVTHERLADRWDGPAWLGPLLGVGLGLLTLPAAAMVLVSLLVLAAQGVATWLVVTAAALVPTLLGAIGTSVALRRGHPGVVHRTAVLAGVWGVLVTALAVVLALRLDAPERTAVAVLLVLGGTYTCVLALALGAGARLLPVPPAPVEEGLPAPLPAAAAPVDEPGPGEPHLSEVPTPAAAPDDAASDWPEWGAGSVVATIPPADAPDGPTDVDHPRRAPKVVEFILPETDDAAPAPASGRPVGDADDADVVVTQVVEVDPAPAEPAPADAEPADAAPVEPAPARQPRRTSSARTGRDPARGARAPRTSGTGGARTAPKRRSATAARTAARSTARRPAGDDPATERLAATDGDDGPPTQRLPAVD